MEQRGKPSVIPIYLVGVVWLVFAGIYPLYRMRDYMLCGLASILVYLVARAVIPNRRTGVKPEAERKTGDAQPERMEAQQKSSNPEVAALVQQRDEAVAEMRRLNDRIENLQISAQIDHMETVTRKIMDLVVEDPKKLPQIRRFMDYYLPTTLKLLRSYSRMNSAGISGENIDATKQKVERMMATIVQAFDKQLDALFGDEALDISTDITVMENLLSQEGLGGLQM